MISNAFVPSPGLTREESIRQSSLPGEGPTNQHHSTGFFDGSNFWGAAYSGDSKDRCCCLQACVCPRGSTESSDGGCGWRRSWNHFVEMARVTWSCKDARHELDKESLERMKSTYWLSRVVRQKTRRLTSRILSAWMFRFSFSRLLSLPRCSTHSSRLSTLKLVARSTRRRKRKRSCSSSPWCTFTSGTRF